MGKKTQYKSYQAYSYLLAGIDYPAFEMADWNWSGGYLVPLTSEQEERVEILAKESIFIAMHEHPVYFPKDVTQKLAYYHNGREVCAYDALAVSYIDCIFDNLMPASIITSKSGWKWNDVIHDFGMRSCDIAHQDFLIQCRHVEDIYRAFREGRIAWVPSMEGAAPIENELDRIDILYGLGIRVMGIAFSEANTLGSGLKEDRDGGLTKFGKAAVERMNKVGMLIDCSHCGPLTTMDTVTHSSQPIVLSHVGARALWDSKRLFSDEVLKAVADRGGIIGIEAAPHTTITKTRYTHDIDSVMEHFKYITDLVGIENVTFGIDSIYGDHVGLYHIPVAGYTSIGGGAITQNEYKEVPYVKGLENPTEASKNIIRWLVKQNYIDADIKKIIGMNVLRVLKQVWK